MEEENPKPKVLEIDDGGSFDQLVKQTLQSVEKFGGTRADAINLLTFKVLTPFIERVQKNSTKNKFSGCCHPEEAKKAKTLKKKLKKEKINFEKEGLEPPPSISTRLARKIEEKGGRDIKLVIMKQLYNTDLSTGHGRLSIPKKKIRLNEDNYFLTEGEKKCLSDEERMDVMLIEPCGAENVMEFAEWEIGNSVSYVFTGEWNRFMERNRKHLKVNDVIQVWSFRIGTKLWFAIDKIWDAPSTSAPSS